MNRRRQTLRLFAASLLLLGGLTALSCGGGGGNVPGGMMGGGLTAAFTPSNPTPSANSISMSTGMVADDLFEIVISVSDITEFFGTAFRVSFDSASAQFQSFDESGTFLQEMLGAYDVNAVVDPNDAGMILVNATLQSQVPGTNPTSLTTNELLRLTFRATNATAGAGNTFGFDGAPTRVVTTCPATLGACSDIPDGNLSWNGGVMTAVN